MGHLEIPPKLDRWVVAYRKMREGEYEFYLRELAVMNIQIRAVKLEGSKKYYGEIKFGVNKSVTASLPMPKSVSSSGERAVIKSLQEFLNYRVQQESRSRKPESTPAVIV